MKRWLCTVCERWEGTNPLLLRGSFYCPRCGQDGVRGLPIRFTDLTPEQRVRVLRKYDWLGKAPTRGFRWRTASLIRLRNYITGQEDQP